MKLKIIIPFIVAIGLGVLAMKLGKGMLRGQRPSGQGAVLAKVLVAAADLEPGRQLAASDFKPMEVPPTSVPMGAFKEANAAAGRVLKVPLAKGQIVMESSLAPVGSGSGLQGVVPSGMRAVTVEVNEYSGMEGLLIPGCRVDVLVTLAHEQTRANVSRTVVDNVEVIAVGKSLVAKAEKNEVEREVARTHKSVTLLVSPRQAEAIELASAKGKPRLVLRGAQDRSPAWTPGVTIAELIGTEPEGRAGLGSMFAGVLAKMPTTMPSGLAEAPKPVVTRRAVQIIKGGAETTKNFEIMPVAHASGAYEINVEAVNPPPTR